MAVVHVWGDGGHVAHVWREREAWWYALVHVPTGEILAMGEDPKRWRAVERVRGSSRRFGLQEWPAPGALPRARVVRLR